MASTMATMAVLNTKCMNLNTPKTTTTQSKPISKPITLQPAQIPPKGLTISPTQTPTITGPAALAAGAVFATLGSMEPALAAQQIAQIAEADNRGLALLLPIIPALGWVLFNILQPALNQINKMRADRAVVVGLGLGGLGLVFSAQEASARELAEAGGSDSRGQLLLLVVLPAIGWVLFNILQPAMNQLNKMRSQ